MVTSNCSVQDTRGGAVAESMATTIAKATQEHIQELAGEAEYLALWLDCDREGENICYEAFSVHICRSSGLRVDGSLVHNLLSSGLRPSAEQSVEAPI